MTKSVEYEAEGPDGKKFKFMAPEDASEETLQRYAFIEYQIRNKESKTQAAPAGGEQPMSATPSMGSDATEPPPESPEDFEKRVQAGAQQQDIRQAQLYGGAAGTGMSALRAGRDAAGAAAQGLAQRAEMGRIAAQQAAGVPAAPTAGQQAARILQGTPGDIAGTTGRARSTGFNVETAQQAARTAESERLINELRQRGAVPRSAPQVLAEMPGLTASPSGVLYPRGTASPPVTPPRPSGLDQVTATFRSMMGPVGAAVKYATPPLALAAAAGEGVRAKQMQESGDKTGAALSGLSALGALGSMSSTLAPIAIPVGAGAAGIQYMRGRLEPNAPVSYEQEVAASRPAFGYYPHLARRRPRTVSP